QSQDGRQGRRAAEEGAVLQAGQGTEGTDQQGAGADRRHTSRRRLGAAGRDRRVGRDAGIGDWGLGIRKGPFTNPSNPQSPIPNPQSPLPVMQQLWAPWRLAYVTSASGPVSGCIFCDLSNPNRADLIVAHGRVSFVILNLYPYNNGHLMVVP